MKISGDMQVFIVAFVLMILFTLSCQAAEILKIILDHGA